MRKNYNKSSGTRKRSGSVSKPADDKPTAVRLNKAIADAGIASRRAADALIANGRVKINGNVVTNLSTRVSRSDKVTVDGKPIGDPERRVYILLNKSRDTISTAKDERGRRTVLEGITRQERLYPVGRLDRNTTGVLLITNDGELSARLMHPRYGVERVYDVELDKALKTADAKSIAAGVELDNGDVTQPCQISIEHANPTHVGILLREGKNREVRRLFEKFGYTVTRLHRSMYAGLTTRGLARGEWRYLERKEITALHRLVDVES